MSERQTTAPSIRSALRERTHGGKTKKTRAFAGWAAAFATDAFTFFLCALLFSGAAESAALTKKGLILVASGVLPAVFPFMVLTSLLCQSGAAQRIGWWLGRPFAVLFRMPRVCVFPVILGWIAGFPHGARAAAQLYERGLCDERDARRLTAVCNFCGPSFLVSAVGAGTFGSPRFGWFLYGAQTVCALLFGFFYLRAGAPRARRSAYPYPPLQSVDLAGAVADAGTGALQITAFVVFFYLAGGLVLAAFPSFFARFPAAAPMISGVLEMTSGISRLPDRGAASAVLSALITGAGGVSGAVQTRAALRGTGISMRGYYLAHFLVPAATAALCAGAYACGLF